MPAVVHTIPNLGRALTSLPALLDTGEGPESFASHVDRVAAAQIYPLPATTLLSRAGVMTADRYDALPYGYGVALTPEGRACFAQVFRLTEEEVQDMLLVSLDGRVFNLSGMDITDASSVRAVANREWAGFAGSSFCPDCLGETGGWRMHWKLWFSFACLTHRVLLVNRCPRCQRHTGNYRADQGNRPRFATMVPQPGHCANPLAAGAGAIGGAARPCGLRLAEVVTTNLSEAPRLLMTQRHLRGVMEAGTATVAGESVTSLLYFGQLRSLMALVMYIGQAGDLGDLPAPILEAAELAFEERDAVRHLRRGQKGAVHHPYKSPPTDLRLVAAVLPLACEVLAQPDQQAVAVALQPFVSRVRGWRGSSVRTVGREFHLRGALATAFNDLLSERATFDRTIGVRAGSPESAGAEYAQFHPDHVPPLLWSEDYRRDFAPLLEGLNIGETPARATISMALVKLCGPYTWDGAVTALGLDGCLTSANSVRIVGHLRTHGRTTLFQETLHHLARRLETTESKVDYRSRRAALSGFMEITPQDWAEIATRTGMKGKSGALRRNAAAWVWARLTGSAPYFSPALNSDPERQESLREVYRRFEDRDLPDLQLHLEALVRSMEMAL